MEAGKVGDSNEIAPEWQERQCYSKKALLRHTKSHL